MCAQCAPGFASGNVLSGAVNCVPCSPGSYAPVGGFAACNLCPPGEFSAQQMATACVFCPAGQFQSAVCCCLLLFSSLIVFVDRCCWCRLVRAVVVPAPLVSFQLKSLRLRVEPVRCCFVVMLLTHIRVCSGRRVRIPARFDVVFAVWNWSLSALVHGSLLQPLPAWVRSRSLTFVCVDRVCVSFQNPFQGALQCSICSSGRFANTTGMSFCISCAGGKYSDVNEQPAG